jgi:SPP1 family predicted phage head-tail adaptor
MIHAGAMRHKITIQSQADSTNAFGTTRTWSDYRANTYAEILSPSAGRDVLGGAEGNKETIRFRLRYTTGIEPDMRVVHGGQNYRITHVENVRGMNIELLITTETART